MVTKTRKHVKLVTKDFIENSTAHGISHAVQASARNWKIFWICLFLVCICCLSLQIVDIVRQYLAFGKTVSIELKFEKSPFPSVTLCNLNPYKLSLLRNVDNAQTTLSMMDRAMGKSQPKPRVKRRSKVPGSHQPVIAPCKCEPDEIGNRIGGSCLPAHKDFLLPDHFKQTTCICDYRHSTQAAWPCYPESEWFMSDCNVCTLQNHCAMPENSTAGLETQPCYCHEEFNHCVVSYLDPLAHIDNVHQNVAQHHEHTTSTTTTSTTHAPEVEEAHGYEGMTDEVAITTKGKENMIFAIASLPIDNREYLSYAKREFILKCSFNGLQCDIDNDFRLHLDPSYGNCFTFNWNQSNDRVVSRAGANYGLRVLLYANASDYLPTSEAIGVRMITHEKSSVPFPDAFGYSAPTGFLSSFYIRMRRFRRLSAPYGECREPSTSLEKSYIYSDFMYSVEGCYRSCLQAALVETCNCSDPRYPLLEGHSACDSADPVARACLENTTLYHATQGHSKCYCPQPCEEKSYDISFSAAIWPSGSAKVGDCKQGDEMCIERFRINAAMIQVFYGALNYESYVESPSYTFVNLLSDFGGTCGLYLGISILSMTELLVYLYNLLVTCWSERKIKAENSSAEANPFIPIDASDMPCMCDCSIEKLELIKSCPRHSGTNGMIWLWQQNKKY